MNSEKADATSKTNFKLWLKDARKKHERLTPAVVELIRGLLRTRGIDFLSVEGRTKSESSVIEKCDRKSYNNPQEQLTDLSGIRIITYLESQALQIAEVIRSTFEVDEANSLDRNDILGSDRIGYRSVHFVCELGRHRTNLPEYEGLAGMKFEIQLRTVLQHAWAELAHDRSFKLGLDLPKAIQRKLNLHAGMLEVVDSAFDEIAREIDNYSLSIGRKSIDEMDDIELNSISLGKYLDQISALYGLSFVTDDISDDVVKELRLYGVSTIGDLKKIATRSLIAEIENAAKPNQTRIGFLRDLMMYDDVERYFRCAPEWGVIHLNDALPLAAKYGPELIARLFSDHDVDIRQDEDDFFWSGYSELLAVLSRRQPS
ncbi:GTP pyrophosphokinase family protein [Bradyrhizobium erythrophlei]|uniref:GTP pyrophosphokinase n=1 Tax=Bradyrhizobium erythrophlei TaxID=1437360 RepID=UPI0035ED997C